MKELQAKSSLYETGKTDSLDLWPVMLVEDSFEAWLVWDSKVFSLIIRHQQCCTVAQMMNTNVTFYY